MEITLEAKIEGIEGVDRMKNGVEKALSKILRSAAFFIQGEAAIASRVDTSAMRNGWFVSLQGFSDFSEVLAKAHALNPSAKQFGELLPPGDLTAYVANVMGYAFWHEYGSSRIPPQPMLGPAIEAVKGHLPRLVSDALKESK